MLRNWRDVVTSVLDSRGCSSQSDLSGELEPAMTTIRQSDSQTDRQSDSQTVRQTVKTVKTVRSDSQTGHRAVSLTL